MSKLANATHNGISQASRHEKTPPPEGDPLSLPRIMADLSSLVFRCRHDSQRTLVSLPPHCTEVFGYATEALLAGGSLSLLQWVHPADRSRLLGRIEAAVGAGRPYQCGYRVVTAEGAVRQVWERGQCAGADWIEGIIMDVTDCADAQAAPATDTPQIEHEISSEINLQKVLHTIARHAVELSQSDKGGAFALYPSTGVIFAGYQVSEPLMDAIRQSANTFLAHVPIARAIRTRGPVQVADIREADDMTLRPWLEEQGIQAELVIPLLKGEQAVGGIVLGQHCPRHFSEDEIAALQALARQWVGAVENASLFESERHARRQTETLYQLARALINVEGLEQVMRLGVDSVVAALAADRVALAILAADSGRVTALVRGGSCEPACDPDDFSALWGDLARWVMAAGLPLGVQSAEPDAREDEAARALRIEARIGAVLVVPLIYHDQVLGVLVAAQPIDRRPFGEQDVTLLSTVANQIAAAIQNAQLFASLAREKGRLELLYRLGRYLSETLDIRAVAQRALDEIGDVLGTLRGSVEVRVPDRDTLELVAMSGYSDESVDDLGARLDWRVGDGLAGWVYAHQQSALVNDVTRDARWLVIPGLDDDVRSAVCVPLICGEKAVGVLTIASAEPGFFGEDHLLLVESTATTVAVAIANARYFQEMKRRAWEQEQVSHIVRALNALDVKASFPLLAQSTRELTGCQHICIALLDESREHFSVTLLKPPYPALGEGPVVPVSSVPVYWEALNSRAYLIEDEVAVSAGDACHIPAIRSRISLVLRAGGESIGLFSLGAETPAAFREAQIPILQQIADALAIAIEHSRLFRAEQRQRELAERLRDTALLVNTLDFQQVLEEIMGQLESIFPYASGTILLLEDDVMRVIAVRNLSPEALGREMPLAEFPYNRRLAQGETVVIRDTSQGESGWVHFADGAHIRSNIGVPLWVRNRVIGALTIDSDVPNSYNEGDTRLVQAFAQQAAIAIENARLFEAERAQRELAEALEEAATVISSALDFDRVLDHILDQVARVVEGDTFNIMMIEDDVACVVRWRGYEIFDFVDEVGGISVPLETYPSLMTMVEKGSPVVIPDTLQDPTWVSSPPRAWRRSYVAAPIRIAGKTVGFLNVNSSHAGRFSVGDARRLQAFADHAAIAIQNAHLYEQQLHYTEQLEHRVRDRTVQLEARTSWLEAILSSTSEGIIVTDSDGGIVQTNRVAGLWLEQSLSAEDAHRLRETVRGLARRAAARPDTVIELTGMDLELSAAPISGQGAEGPAVVVAVHDVTYLTALDRMKSQFVSNVSHELRTPITAIRLYCSLIKTASSKRLLQYLKALDQESERLGKLVQDILDISRIEGGRMELEIDIADLNTLVSGVAKSHRVLAEAQGLRLVWQAPSEALDIRVDGRRFVQVLNNLVENAIHYSPLGGEIRLSTGLQTSEGRTWAIVQVVDTGIGIPPDEIEHVFERFFRGYQPQEMQLQGSGLGLAIVREILELHGGKVTVESQVGVGSVFTAWMPASLREDRFQEYFREMNEW